MAGNGISIRTTSSGKFVGQVRRGGERKTTKSYATREEAMQAGGNLLVQMGAALPDDMRVAKHIGNLLELQAREAIYSQTTADQLRMIQQKTPMWLQLTRLSDVTPLKLNQAYARLQREGWSVHRVEKLHQFLSAGYKTAILHDWVQTNPCRDATCPKRPATQRAGSKVTVEAAQKLIAAAARTNAQLPLALRLAANTGLRRSEVVALRWANVNDLNDGSIWVCENLVEVGGEVFTRATKTGSRGWRRVDLSADLMAELLTWKNDERPGPFVFSHDIGVTPWRPSYMTRAFARLAKGTDITLHSLRHLHATVWLGAGVPLHEVAARLGHADPATTARIYAHAIPGRQKAHAEALGF